MLLTGLLFPITPHPGTVATFEFCLRGLWLSLLPGLWVVACCINTKSREAIKKAAIGWSIWIVVNAVFFDLTQGAIQMALSAFLFGR
jgi:hypothetical protein